MIVQIICCSRQYSLCTVDKWNMLIRTLNLFRKLWRSFEIQSRGVYIRVWRISRAISNSNNAVLFFYIGFGSVISGVCKTTDNGPPSNIYQLSSADGWGWIEGCFSKKKKKKKYSRFTNFCGQLTTLLFLEGFFLLLNIIKRVQFHEKFSTFRSNLIPITMKLDGFILICPWVLENSVNIFVFFRVKTNSSALCHYN